MDPRKNIVRRAYDAIAESWGREREAMDDLRERVWIDRFASALTGERVLDLGCGGGVVLTRLAARGLTAVGVDFSRAQLARARRACAAARLIQGDLAEVEFAPASFGGVLVYDSLWHLPREEHGAVLTRVRSWMTDGAPLLFTVGDVPRDYRDEEQEQRLCGAPIYYSGWPREDTFELLRAARFELIAFDDTPERALLVLARAA